MPYDKSQAGMRHMSGSKGKKSGKAAGARNAMGSGRKSGCGNASGAMGKHQSTRTD